MIARTFVCCILVCSASAYSFAPVLRSLKAPASVSSCRRFPAGHGMRRSALFVKAQEQSIPEGFREFKAEERTLEEWFAKLADSRSSIRQMASIKIAEMHDKEGEEQEKAVIQRLFGYLTLEDVHERRAAVQALGMIGQKVLPPLVDMLLETEDRVVRASCSKAIGAVALKNPELLPQFPQLALDGMKKAILDIPDPVTKIATISSLGQIGGGDVAHGYPGCERALDVLVEALEVSDDMGLAAAAVNAVATIGKTNEPYREKALASLEKLKERAKDIDGFMFVEQMIEGQIEQLNGGGIVGEINKSRSTGQSSARDNLAKQVAAAKSSGMIADASAPPPDDDWMSAM